MTETLTIETLWGARRGESTPELMAAWDEYTIDNWREGWSEACRKAIESYGSDLDTYRYIVLTVDLGKIEQAFEPTTVDAEVSR